MRDDGAVAKEFAGEWDAARAFNQKSWGTMAGIQPGPRGFRRKYGDSQGRMTAAEVLSGPTYRVLSPIGVEGHATAGR